MRVVKVKVLEHIINISLSSLYLYVTESELYVFMYLYVTESELLVSLEQVSDFRLTSGSNFLLSFPLRSLLTVNANEAAGVLMAISLTV